MNFNFLPIQLNKSMEQFANQLSNKEINDEATMYDYRPPDKTELLGNPVINIKMYFHKTLVSIYYTLQVPKSEMQDNIDAISILSGLMPIKRQFKRRKWIIWHSPDEALYCLVDSNNNQMKLYHTLKEYDVME